MTEGGRSLTGRRSCEEEGTLPLRILTEEFFPKILTEFPPNFQEDEVPPPTVHGVFIEF